MDICTLVYLYRHKNDLDTTQKLTTNAGTPPDRPTATPTAIDVYIKESENYYKHTLIRSLTIVVNKNTKPATRGYTGGKKKSSSSTKSSKTKKSTKSTKSSSTKSKSSKSTKTKKSKK